MSEHLERDRAERLRLLRVTDELGFELTDACVTILRVA